MCVKFAVSEPLLRVAFVCDCGIMINESKWDIAEKLHGSVRVRLGGEGRIFGVCGKDVLQRTTEEYREMKNYDWVIYLSESGDICVYGACYPS
jgi:hypothetical protein